VNLQRCRKRLFSPALRLVTLTSTMAEGERRYPLYLKSLNPTCVTTEGPFEVE